jgi:hypothetical protein
MDMLRADVERQQQYHDDRAKSNDVVKNPSGGYRYKFNPEKSASRIADQEVAMSPRRKAQFANEIGQRHAGLMTDAEAASLETLIQTPDGFAQMRALNDRLNRRSAMQRSQNVRNNVANRNMTIAANNPRVAQGLYMRSLQEAARSGDPMQVAAVHSSFGNDRAARDYMSLAGQQQEAAAAMAIAQTNAAGGDDAAADPKTLADQLALELGPALATQDPAARKLALEVLLRRLKVPEELIDKRIATLIQSAAGGQIPAPNSPGWLGFISNLWNSLQSAPPQAWTGSPTPPQPPSV